MEALIDTMTDTLLEWKGKTRTKTLGALQAMKWLI